MKNARTFRSHSESNHIESRRDLVTACGSGKGKEDDFMGSSRVVQITCIAMLLFAACADPITKPSSGGSQAGHAVAYSLQIVGDGSAQVTGIDLAAGDVEARVTIKPSNGPAVFPDSVVMANGKQLIVAHTTTQGQELKVLDSNTGETLDSEPVSDLVANQVPTDYMFPAGGRVFIYQSTIVGEATSEQRISTYDVSSQSLLPETIHLGRCDARAMLAPLSESRLAVYCGVDDQLHLMTITDKGDVVSKSSTALPSPTSLASVPEPQTVVSVTDSADGKLTYIVKRGGDVHSFDTSTGRLEESLKLPIPKGAYVNSAESSADGTDLVVTTGDGLQFDASSASSISRISTGAWRVVATTDLHQQVSDLVVTPDGRALMFADDSRAILETSFVNGRFSRAKRIPLPSGWAVDLEVPLSPTP